MSPVNCFQQQQSCKRKVDDYAPGECSASVKMRLDVNNFSCKSFSGELPYHEVNSTVPVARSTECLVESSKSNSSVQFFVRMFTGMKTLFVRADANDTVKSVHELIQSTTGIPITEQRLIYQSRQLYFEQTLGECCIEQDAELKLVGIMRSTVYPKAYQLINEMVLLMCGLGKGGSVDAVNYNEAQKVIKCNLLKYLKQLPTNDHGKAVEYLQVFLSSGAPGALASCYKSPNNRVFAADLIKQLVMAIYSLPKTLYQQCAPILLVICKVLRGTALYQHSAYIFCRNYLCNMMGHVKIERRKIRGGRSNSHLVLFTDMVNFIGEAASRIIIYMHAGSRSDTSHFPLMSDVISLKTFLFPVIRFIKEEIFRRVRYGNPPNDGYLNMSNEEYGVLGDIFNKLLKKIDFCLQKMEGATSIGCYQYLAVLMELHNVSKIFPDLGKQLWITLRNRKRSFCYLINTYARRSDDYGWISEYKEVTNFECRRHLSMMLLPEVKDEYDEDLVEEMIIDRKQLLAESFQFIAYAEAETLRAGLDIEFQDEEAYGPGVLREWFVLVCQAIFDPQYALFVACPNDRRRFFPNPASQVNPLHLDYYKFSGRMTALALIHKVQVGVVFDRALFLQLAGRGVSLEDIRDADPILYSSCKNILEMDPEIVDQDALSLTYAVETCNLGSRNVVELCPNGKNTVVTSRNRGNYIDLFLQYHFVDSVKEQVAQFIQGFDDIIGSERLRISFFRYLELEDLDGMLYGSEKAISVDDWKAHTEYHGYMENDPQISWFWQTVGSMSAEQRKALLFFWTSLKYLPVEGFRGLTSRLSIQKRNESCNRLPSSQTCFYQLSFPPYQSLKVMHDRLSIITQEHVGCSFGTT
ncbi:E3 ubiquitin-protein ligase UPL5-like [Apium graveolens]|uniref:E3 ubiquitin-protein ligase UPL5-like n=1 Tax=Apium graveolens TaxID=4045 RepID=UPI003D7BCAB1